jgi:hypothetical protein
MQTVSVMRCGGDEAFGCTLNSSCDWLPYQGFIMQLSADIFPPETNTRLPSTLSLPSAKSWMARE